MEGFREDQRFLDAVRLFCTSGNFELDYSDASAGCVTRKPFEQRYIDFLDRLSTIRREPVHFISLRCAAIKDALRFRNLAIDLLSLEQVTVRDLEIINSKFAGGIEIRGQSVVKNTVAIDAVTQTGPIIIENSTITEEFEPGRAASFRIENSSISALKFVEATINGDLLEQIPIM